MPCFIICFSFFISWRRFEKQIEEGQ